MRIGVVLMMAFVWLCSSSASAQESEFQGKMLKIMNAKKKAFDDRCGGKVTMKWVGKLGHDPNNQETAKKGHALGALVGVALQGVMDACQSNAPVKQALSKVATVEAKKGSGTIACKVAGTTLTILVDGAFEGSNPAGQRAAMVKKLKKDLDK